MFVALNVKSFLPPSARTDPATAAGVPFEVLDLLAARVATLCGLALLSDVTPVVHGDGHAAVAAVSQRARDVCQHVQRLVPPQGTIYPPKCVAEFADGLAVSHRGEAFVFGRSAEACGAIARALKPSDFAGGKPPAGAGGQEAGRQRPSATRPARA